MQPPVTFSILNQVSTSSIPRQILLVVLSQLKRHFNSAIKSQQCKFLTVKSNGVRSSVISDSIELRLWTGNDFLFAFPCPNRFQGFSSFNPGSTYQLCWKSCKRSMIVVGSFVQLGTTAQVVIPSRLTNSIKRPSVLLNCSGQYLSYFCTRLQLDADRSLHCSV